MPLIAVTHGLSKRARGAQTFHAESRTYWFNHWVTSHAALDESDAQQAMTDFRLLGVVLGLAIYNTVLLDFPLPIALYRKICNQKVGLGDLEKFQPTVGKCGLPACCVPRSLTHSGWVALCGLPRPCGHEHVQPCDRLANGLRACTTGQCDTGEEQGMRGCRSLRQLLEYSGPGSVEDIFCQVFAIEEDVGGAQHSVELCPGGSNIPVTEENRRDFVDKYVDYILTKSVQRQYEAFLDGLMMLCKGPAISLFSPVEMERLVCGNPHLDFAALKAASKYEAGFTASTPAVIWLWDIAENEFDLAEKRMLLKFFTGAPPAVSRCMCCVAAAHRVCQLWNRQFVTAPARLAFVGCAAPGLHRCSTVAMQARTGRQSGG